MGGGGAYSVVGIGAAVGAGVGGGGAVVGGGGVVVEGGGAVVVGATVVVARAVVGAAAVEVGPTRSVVVVRWTARTSWMRSLPVASSGPAARPASMASMRNPVVLTASQGQVLDQPERCNGVGAPGAVDDVSVVVGATKLGWSSAGYQRPSEARHHPESG
jgi:hypothetical protein